ncbi:hypothetical protein [Marinobacter xestospongiae]|uniref:DUF4124 domain-containing protein n=1 Tax=Marinobacter xestospongiae TaxID=994319 RepID=A0ABU3W253_9GAMM|nr:hypothetical protein [Marinobacter xestospongiae]MDV2080491.1 hypothetical protein [Marinobacter xestospongiae]
MGFLKIFLAVVAAQLVILLIVAVTAVFFMEESAVELARDIGIDLNGLTITIAGEDWIVFDNQNTPDNTVRPYVASVAPTVPPWDSNQPSRSNHTNDNNRRNTLSSAARSSREMCRFWHAEFIKNRSEQSRIYRESACKRYERLSGRSRSTIVGNVNRQLDRVDQEREQVLARRREQREDRQREQAELQAKCDRYNRRIDVLDAKLRSGYTVSQGNRWRAERREVSQKYSRECILGR